MKILALLSIIAVIISAHAHQTDYKVKTKEDLARAREECVSQLKIPQDLVEKYKKWEYPDDEKSRCYLKCIFEKFELFDEKDGFNIHNIHHQLAGDKADHSDDLHRKIENCAKEGADAADLCTKAYRGGICFIRENLQLVRQSVSAN